MPNIIVSLIIIIAAVNSAPIWEEVPFNKINANSKILYISKILKGSHITSRGELETGVAIGHYGNKLRQLRQVGHPLYMFSGSILNKPLVIHQYLKPHETNPQEKSTLFGIRHQFFVLSKNEIYVSQSRLGANGSTCRIINIKTLSVIKPEECIESGRSYTQIKYLGNGIALVYGSDEGPVGAKLIKYSTKNGPHEFFDITIEHTQIIDKVSYRKGVFYFRSNCNITTTNGCSSYESYEKKPMKWYQWRKGKGFSKGK